MVYALAQRGAFIAAAAGNRGIDELVAPAQTPTVLTVGGVEDHNRRWRASDPDAVEGLALSPQHGDGDLPACADPQAGDSGVGALAEPLLVLPPSHIFYEMAAIEQVRRCPARRSGRLAGGFAAPRRRGHRARRTAGGAAG